jgi:hypothetical protein
MHMKFMSKQSTQHQCSNSKSRWMTFVFIPYKPIEIKFCTTIIAKLWPMKLIILCEHVVYCVIYVNSYQTLNCGGILVALFDEAIVDVITCYSHNSSFNNS